MADRANPPTIWILWHSRLGDLGQMQVLAGALGWPHTIKKLAFRAPHVPALARLLLDRRASDPLEPPWPDLVLCGEGLTSVIARCLRRRAAGAVKAVCLGRPAGSPAAFDLVLTTAQFRLPKLPQVVQLTLPLSATMTPGPDLVEQPEGEALARPITLVLVGGTSLPEWLDAAAARALARDLGLQARRNGGTLQFVTGPRTGEAAAAALAQSVAPPHRLHLWRGQGNDSYRRFLAMADEIVVTSDSVSMVADALATRKPVYIYRLPRRWTPGLRLAEGLRRLAWERPTASPISRPIAWLFDQGVIEASADRRLLFDKLAAERRLAWFGEGRAALQPRSSTGDVDSAVAQVSRLFRLDQFQARRSGRSEALGAALP